MRSFIFAKKNKTEKSQRWLCMGNISVSPLKINISIHTSEKNVFMVTFAVSTQLCTYLVLQVGTKATVVKSLLRLHVFIGCYTVNAFRAKKVVKVLVTFLKNIISNINLERFGTNYVN